MKKSVEELKLCIKEAAEAEKGLNKLEVGNAFILRSSEDSIVRPCYLSQEECNQIAGLYRWLISSGEITEQYMLDVLKFDEEFNYLLTLVLEVPEFVETLKVHGPKSAAILYINQRIYERKDLCK